MSAAIIAIQVTNVQPDGECTDHVSLWLWVYMGALLLGAFVNTGVRCASKPNSSAALLKGGKCCLTLVGLFGTAWWITGIVWYTQAEDADCAQAAMYLMLAAIILPGVSLILACCAVCIMACVFRMSPAAKLQADMQAMQIAFQQEVAEAANTGASSPQGNAHAPASGDEPA